MLPPNNSTTYLHQTSKALYQSLASVDPQAIWVIQGWMFSFSPDFWHLPQIEAYLSGVPKSGMLVLDLDAYAIPVWAQTNSFFGKGKKKEISSSISSSNLFIY
jgi:alpha-N-acetylglucosaminidase